MLGPLIPVGERHFRRALAEFLVDYHRERNHQGLGHEPIDGVGGEHHDGRVRRRQRIGGLLNYYYRRMLERGAISTGAIIGHYGVGLECWTLAGDVLAHERCKRG